MKLSFKVMVWISPVTAAPCNAICMRLTFNARHTILSKRQNQQAGGVAQHNRPTVLSPIPKITTPVSYNDFITFLFGYINISVFTEVSEWVRAQRMRRNPFGHLRKFNTTNTVL